jgi:hypothetical protein
MLVLFCFLMGIANFAMHKAVAQSGHPFVEDTKRYFGKHFSPYASYGIELLLLIAAMAFAQSGSQWAALLYWGYTGFNGVATWLLLTGRA